MNNKVKDSSLMLILLGYFLVYNWIKQYVIWNFRENCWIGGINIGNSRTQ